MNRFGEVTISFNETMIVPENWAMINSTDLDIKVRAFDPDRQALKGFEWELKSYGTTKMVIIIEFTYPERITDQV